MVIPYTDGSRSDNGVGYGYVMSDEKILQLGMHKLRSCNSIFQAESLAILEALRSVVGKCGEEVVLNTDRKAVVLALMNIFPKSKIISEILNLCYRDLNNIKIIVNWVKAHVGHGGHEY